MSRKAAISRITLAMAALVITPLCLSLHPAACQPHALCANHSPMLDTVRLYDLTDSPFCLKARICLNLKRVPYRRVIATFGRMSELYELNALGQVPVLVVAGRAIPDSSQIAR